MKSSWREAMAAAVFGPAMVLAFAVRGGAELDVGEAIESIEELLVVVSSEASGFRRQLVALKDVFAEE